MYKKIINASYSLEETREIWDKKFRESTPEIMRDGLKFEKELFKIELFAAEKAQGNKNKNDDDWRGRDEKGNIETWRTGTLADTQKDIAKLKEKTLIITGAKGGIGKTLLTAHLGMRLHAKGLRVLILDWDSSPNMKISMLGDSKSGYAFNKNFYLYTMLQASDNVNDREILNNSGGTTLYKYIYDFFRGNRYNEEGSLGLNENYDVILIDNSAGNSLPQTILSSFFNKNLIIATPEEPALEGALTHLRTLAAQNKNNPQHFYLVFNNCLPEQSIYANRVPQKQRMETLCQELLAEYRPESELEYMFNIMNDPSLAKQPFMENLEKLKKIEALKTAIENSKDHPPKAEQLKKVLVKMENMSLLGLTERLAKVLSTDNGE